MQIKFILTADGVEHELYPDCVKNWGDIKCSWKRKDFSGIVRSFTSKFEFVNAAYDILLDQFQLHETEGNAVVAMYIIRNDWKYEKVFECPLDFSTYQEEHGCIKISAIDNSLAALIKANKGTKYEYVVGEDIVQDGSYLFNRIPMQESVTYAITQGESQDDGSLVVDYGYSEETKGCVFFGTIGNDTDTANDVLFHDDVAAELESVALEIGKSRKIDVECTIEHERIINKTNDYSLFSACDLYCAVTDGSNITTEVLIHSIRSAVCVGEYESIEEYNAGYHYVYIDPSYNFNSDRPQIAAKTRSRWVSENIQYIAIIGGIVYELTVEDDEGEVFANQATSTGKLYHEYNLCVRNLKFSLDVPDGGSVSLYIKPQILSSQIVSGARIARNAKISNMKFRSSRFKFTWTAKGDPISINYLAPKSILDALLGSVTQGKALATSYISNRDDRMEYTKILPAEIVRAIPGAKLYTSFNEFCDWMEAVFGYTYYIDGNTVKFVHLSELYNAGTPIKDIEHARDVSFSIDGGAIYSSLEIGYDKKDYENINGRIEFNMYNEYSTGSTVSDKKLSLKSKYRADCMGLEFAVQKRGKDTMDSTSDKDVFFVYDKPRTLPQLPVYMIMSAAYSHLINGAFCPMNCVRANAGRIGAQADGLTLSYASSPGNTEVMIGSTKMTDDIQFAVGSRLFTVGQLSFETNDINVPDDINCLVRLTDNGITYEGYISELELKPAKTSSARYKLIVKSRTIEP